MSSTATFPEILLDYLTMLGFMKKSHGWPDEYCMLLKSHESMINMTLLKTSAICVSVSVLSYLGVIVRGDVVCPGNFSACLIVAFFLFGLAAVVCLILGLVQRRHKIISS